MIKDLYIKNENGKGYWSIGKWNIIDNEKDLDKYKLHEYQIKHAKLFLEKYKQVIIMREAFSKKYKIHSHYSFCFLFMSDICGELAYNELNNNDLELYRLCYKILDDTNFFSNNKNDNSIKNID